MKIHGKICKVGDIDFDAAELIYLPFKDTDGNVVGYSTDYYIKDDYLCAIIDLDLRKLPRIETELGSLPNG